MLTFGEFVLKEEFFFSSMSQSEQDNVYQVFKDSYEQSTGKAFSKNQFMSRAMGWEFYGSSDTYLAIRRQRSGMIKLNGIASSETNPRLKLTKIKNALEELVEKNPNSPIWGAVSEEIARMADKVKIGGQKVFYVPHKMFGGKFLMSKIVASIPASVMGGQKIEFNETKGSISLDVPGIGTTEKYLIANKAYFTKSKDEMLKGIIPVPSDFINSKLVQGFFKLIGI